MSRVRFGGRALLDLATVDEGYQSLAIHVCVSCWWREWSFQYCPVTGSYLNDILELPIWSIKDAAILHNIIVSALLFISPSACLIFPTPTILPWLWIISMAQNISYKPLPVEPRRYVDRVHTSGWVDSFGVASNLDDPGYFDARITTSVYRVLEAVR